MQHCIRRATWLSFVACVLPWAAASDLAYAQRDRADSEATAPIEAWPVRDNVYVLFGASGNITVSIGPSGILLVGTGLEDQSAAVGAALERLDRKLSVSGAPKRPLRYIVNTSVHPEYTGGNAALRSLQAEAASVIAHEKVLIRLVDQNAPFAQLPTTTFGDGEHNLAAPFNGENIRLIHMPAATTDGDAIVHFRGADVISTGALISMNAYPPIDIARGGSINGLIEALNTILKIAIPGVGGDGGTLIVPGHGRLADSADVGAYRDMLTIIRDHVQYLIDSGMTLDQIQTARPTLGYDRRFGSAAEPETIEAFVEAVYRSLAAAPR